MSYAYIDEAWKEEIEDNNKKIFIKSNITSNDEPKLLSDSDMSHRNHKLYKRNHIFNTSNSTENIKDFINTTESSQNSHRNRENDDENRSAISNDYLNNSSFNRCTYSMNHIKNCNLCANKMYKIMEDRFNNFLINQKN